MFPEIFVLGLEFVHQGLVFFHETVFGDIHWFFISLVLVLVVLGVEGCLWIFISVIFKSVGTDFIHDPFQIVC
jgi:hypothetical protein